MNRRPPRNGEIIKKVENTLLIDGNSLFKTGFFGAKDQYNHLGEHIGGVYQFLTVLRKLLDENLFHRVFVFWDNKFSGKLRYNFYKDYKSGRGKDFINGTQPTDENELIERLKVQQYLDELFIRQLEHEIIESDDFIAYYCLNKKSNEKITICSNDRDMCQLISDDINIYISDFKTYVTPENYNQYFKHHLTNSMLIKQIAGDNSDSIKGVKGVKEKTLLTLFPDLAVRKMELDEIITKAKELSEDRIKAKLKPLKSLNNIIYSITDGIQGNKLYEINKLLVDLKTPLLTEDGINSLNELIDNDFNPDDRGIKNAYTLLKRDGIDKILGDTRYNDYLLPFKKLINREIKDSII